MTSHWSRSGPEDLERPRRAGPPRRPAAAGPDTSGHRGHRRQAQGACAPPPRPRLSSRGRPAGPPGRRDGRAGGSGPGPGPGARPPAGRRGPAGPGTPRPARTRGASSSWSKSTNATAPKPSAGLSRCSTASVPTSTSCVGKAAGGRRDLARRAARPGPPAPRGPGSRPTRRSAQPGGPARGADRRADEAALRADQWSGGAPSACWARARPAPLAAGQLPARGASQQAGPAGAVEHAHHPALGPDERHQSLGVEAQARDRPCAPVDAPRAAAQPWRSRAAVDQPDGTGGQQLHGGAGADDHARDAGPPGPLGRDRHRVPGRGLLLAEALVVAVDDDHRRPVPGRAPRPRPGPRPPRRPRPGPGPSRRARTATSPPARRSRPASTPPRLAEGTTTRVGPRWASSATSGVASAAGGRRTMTGRSTGRRPEQTGGRRGRAAGAGLAAGSAGTAPGGEAVASRAPAPAGPAPGRPAGQVHHARVRDPSPGPWRWAGGPGPGGARRRRRRPSRRPAGRRGRPAPAVPIRTSGARRLGTR